MVIARKHILLGMGNPLLDVMATTDEKILEKYKLEANNAIMTDNKDLCTDLANNYTVEYLPGGATQNSIKIAQWMLGGKEADGTSAFMGSVGEDELGSVMVQKASELGVDIRYQVSSEKQTGTCACVVTGANHENRSLVASLAAAECFKADFLKQKENWKVVEESRIFYISGFFLCVSLESMLMVAKDAAENNKIFALNLSAPFISQFFKEQLAAIFPYVDILFGNETEAECFSKYFLEDESLGANNMVEIAKRAAAYPGKVNQRRSRLVVFTQGSDPTIAVQDGQVQQFPVAPCSKEEIVDTNGAGDAFVGGFLAGLVRHSPLSESVRAGQWAAGVVIRRSGCSFPDKPAFVPDYFPGFVPE